MSSAARSDLLDLPMSTPRRIQRMRTRGWRMPAGAVYVGRPTRWGNPFPINGSWIVWAAVAAGYRADAAGRRDASLAFFRTWLTGSGPAGPHATDKGDDEIVYESGVAMSSAEAARGMAATFAWINRETIRVPAPPSLEEVRAALAGRDLACFCPLDVACHADILLDLANG